MTNIKAQKKAAKKASRGYDSDDDEDDLISMGAIESLFKGIPGDRMREFEEDTDFSYPWFVGQMSRKDAVKRLEYSDSGSFLVRISTKDLSGFSLDVSWAGVVRHYKIEKRHDDAYCIRGKRKVFPTLIELVAFYNIKPVSQQMDILAFPYMPSGKPKLDIFGELLGGSGGEGHLAAVKRGSPTMLAKSAIKKKMQSDGIRKPGEIQYADLKLFNTRSNVDLPTRDDEVIYAELVSRAENPPQPKESVSLFVHVGLLLVYSPILSLSLFVLVLNLVVVLLGAFV